jgi:hypothetical protein
MATFRSLQPQRKRVWRISESAPKGEWVDPTKVDERATPPELPEVSSGGWVVSSFDLLHGTDVVEEVDTIPAALFDELFTRPEKGAKGSGK